MPSYQSLRYYLKERETELCVSYISKVEVLGYHKLSEIERQIFNGFFSEIALIPVSNDLLEKSISIRQNTKISLGDSIIAATSILYDVPLLTNNETDFSGIPNMKLKSLASIAP